MAGTAAPTIAPTSAVRRCGIHGVSRRRAGGYRSQLEELTEFLKGACLSFVAVLAE